MTADDVVLAAMDLADDVWCWARVGPDWLRELLRRDWERLAWLQGGSLP